MRAVSMIIARLAGIAAARVAEALMDSVMPVEVMVGGDSIPPSVLILERRVIPFVAGVLPPDDSPLTGISGRPNLWGAHFVDIPLDRFNCVRRQRGRWLNWPVQTHPGIGIDMSHVGALRHDLNHAQVAARPDHIGDPIGSVFGRAGFQRRQHRHL